MTSNSNRRTAAQWLVLTLAVGIMAAVILALACGPSAPTGQDGTPEEATPTPTFTPTPTSTPTPTPAADSAKLNPVAAALLALHADSTADNSPDRGVTGQQSAPGTPSVLIPQTVTLHISTLSLTNTRSFLEANKGSIIETEKLAYNWVVVAEVPLTLLPALTQQQDILFVAMLHGPYRNLGGSLNRRVLEYAAARLAAAGASMPELEPLLMEVRVTKAGYVNVRRFLQDHGVRLTYSDAELRTPPATGEYDLYGFPQLIPVRLLGPVSELPGVIFIKSWPEPHIDSELSDEPQ